jgi:hypothetical protein
MRDVVARNGMALLYAKQADDPELLLIAMSKDPAALYYACDLRNSRDFILEAVSANGLVLEHISEVLRRDHEVVLAAVRQCGLALRFSLIFSDDVLAEALTQTWRCLHAVPESKRWHAYEVIARVHWSCLPESSGTELEIVLLSGTVIMAIEAGEQFLCVQDVSRMLRRTDAALGARRLRFIDGSFDLNPNALVLPRRSDCSCLPRRRLMLTLVLEPAGVRHSHQPPGKQC